MIEVEKASKHNRLKTDILPEKNYNLGLYEHEQLLNTTRYVFSVKVFPGQCLYKTIIF